MKIKRRLTAFLAAAMLFNLTGCQLARQDAGEDAGGPGDRLIGVFITEEYLDLFDFEGYLKDNVQDLAGGGVIAADDSSYQGRLYAELKTLTLTDEENGGLVTAKDYIFEGVEGISYFSATVPATEDTESYTTSSSDQAITDGHMEIHCGDDEDKLTLEGTLYLSAERSGGQYINPVYQSADGRVYAVTGSGFMISGERSEGSVYSQTLEETTTVTENGSRRQASSSITISVAVMHAPEQIAVLQMDADSSVLSRTAFQPGELPGSIKLSPGAAYLLVETHKRGSDGNPQVTRGLYDSSNEALETFYCRKDGVCVKQWTQLEWDSRLQE